MLLVALGMRTAWEAETGERRGGYCTAKDKTVASNTQKDVQRDILMAATGPGSSCRRDDSESQTVIEDDVNYCTVFSLAEVVTKALFQ